MGRTPSPTDSPHGTEMAGLWLWFLECSCLIQSVPRVSAPRALRGGMQMGDPGYVCHGPSIQATALPGRKVALLPIPETPGMQQSAVHLLQEQDTNLPTSTLPTNQE